MLANDHQGTANLSIDATTMTVTPRRTTPYGTLRGTAPAVWPSQKGFVGGTQDDSTGLTQLGHRAYDPGSGRFVTPDPLLRLTTPQQWNAYGYGNANPVVFSDPDGLEPYPQHNQNAGGTPTWGNPYGVSDPVIETPGGSGRVNGKPTSANVKKSATTKKSASTKPATSTNRSSNAALARVLDPGRCSWLGACWKEQRFWMCPSVLSDGQCNVATLPHRWLLRQHGLGPHNVYGLTFCIVGCVSGTYQAGTFNLNLGGIGWDKRKPTIRPELMAGVSAGIALEGDPQQRGANTLAGGVARGAGVYGSIEYEGDYEQGEFDVSNSEVGMMWGTGAYYGPFTTVGSFTVPFLQP